MSKYDDMEHTHLMTVPEMRSVTLQAVRNFLRGHMLDPMKFTCEEAFKVLPSLVKESSGSVAARWYGSALPSQVVYFYHEWEEWRKEVQRSSHP